MARADLVGVISEALARHCEKCGRGPAVKVVDGPTLCAECLDDLEAMMDGLKLAGAYKSALGSGARVRIRMQDGTLYEPKEKR